MVVTENDDRVRALVRLDRFSDTFLYVGRFVESRVLAHMTTAQNAVQQYAELEGKRSHLQITVNLIFAVVALLLLSLLCAGGARATALAQRFAAATA